MEPDYPDPTFHVISSLDQYRENLTNHWRSTDQAPCLFSCSRFLLLTRGFFIFVQYASSSKSRQLHQTLLISHCFKKVFPFFLTHITNVYNFPYVYSIDQEWLFCSVVVVEIFQNLSEHHYIGKRKAVYIYPR